MSRKNRPAPLSAKRLDELLAAKQAETVELACLCCGKMHRFAPDSHEANYVFNVFCDGECEDRYAARL